MPPHDAEPLQVIVHEVVSAQLTPSRQLPSVEHSTSQLRPAGQSILPAHAGVIEQSIVQVCEPGSHEVQIDGHWNPEPLPLPEPLPEPPASISGESGMLASGPPGSTQKPSTQMRPASEPLQLLSGPHANSWLRCWIEQLAAMTIVVARATPCFTADLRS
jgi:hypothetical protein